MNDVTIVIKTFERPDRLDRLIQSIRARYARAVIFVADDSRNPRRPHQVDAFFEMPFDSGVSAGRNLLVNNVKTKYFLLLDDDHLFSDGTDIPGMRHILELTDIDILGGRMEKESGNWHTIDVSNGVLREQRDRNKYGKLAGCLVCDKVANFMLARTARVRAMGGWPEELKIGEHLPFFVAAMGKLKVAYFAGSSVSHQSHRGQPAKYRQRRMRAPLMRDRYLASEFGIGTVIQPSSGRRGRIVFGLGTGRCGTKSLARLLNQQRATEVTHESNWQDMAWAGRTDSVNARLASFRQKLSSFELRLVGDVAFYYLPYVEHILARTPNVAFICLKRGRRETTSSWMRKVRDRHPWINHDGRSWRASNWDKHFPKLGMASRWESAKKYWNDYYEVAGQIERDHPERFRIFDCEALNGQEGQETLLSFLAIPKAEMVCDVGIRLNAGHGSNRGKVSAHRSKETPASLSRR